MGLCKQLGAAIQPERVVKFERPTGQWVEDDRKEK